MARRDLSAGMIRCKWKALFLIFEVAVEFTELGELAIIFVKGASAEIFVRWGRGEPSEFFDVIPFLEPRKDFFHELEHLTRFMSVLLHVFGLPVSDGKFGNPDRLTIKLMYPVHALEEGFRVCSAIGMNANEVDTKVFAFGLRHELFHPIVIRMLASGRAQTKFGFDEMWPSFEGFFDREVGLLFAIRFVEAEHCINPSFFRSIGGFFDFFRLTPVAPYHWEEIDGGWEFVRAFASPSVDPIDLEILKSF